MQSWYNHYKANPAYFWGWLVGLVALGLIGFWMHVVRHFLHELPIPFGKLILDGGFSTFCIVLLIEGFIAGVSWPKKKRINLLWMIGIFILLVIHAFILNETINGTNTLTLKWSTVFMTCITLLASIYLYQYKRIDTEESAEEYLEKENTQIKKIAKAQKSNNPLP